MNEFATDFILSTTNANALEKIATIQSLWSGYGAIDRYKICGAEIQYIIAKHVIPPSEHNHPRGWNTNISHQRKIKSYQVESHWYANYAKQCDFACKVAQCYGLTANDRQFIILLEDLDNAGYSKRIIKANISNMKLCLKWLANFHATFLGVRPDGLWQSGTYWHLETRPDELAALEDKNLKKAAPKINMILNDCPYQTIVHGDAKLANFCFSEDETMVAGLDFQYVGAGCGMKDVAYFIGSCLTEDDIVKYENELLDSYFQDFHVAIKNKRCAVDANEVESSWRALFYVAWADFHRFLKGWNPGHWKINSYSEHITRRVISQLSQSE